MDWRNGFLVSLLLHAVVFLGGGAVFVRPAQYGVEAGTGGIEISLVAAPRENLGQQAEASLSRPPAEEKSREIEAPSESEWAAEQTVSPAPEQGKGSGGDGSSPVPGKDPTTFYSAGGAISEGKSRHLRNPAPPYPWASVTRGEEGRVLLAVSVDEAGRPTRVEIQRSSGFPLLDESSLKTVRRWKFDAAHVGPLAVRSNIQVPIRFVLKKK